MPPLHRTSSRLFGIPLVLLILFASAALSAGLAAYLGPARSGVRSVLVPDRGEWSLTNASPPAACPAVRSCVLYTNSCSEPPSVEQQTYYCCDGTLTRKWEATSSSCRTQYRSEQQPFNDPEASVAAFLQGCDERNGWCVSPASLLVAGYEPVSGQAITAIEGSRNGEPFGCAGPLCEQELVEGANDFTYWALSSYGDSSRMGTLSAQVDTRAPLLSAEVSGAGGQNGWFVSEVTLSARAEDPLPGSGLAGVEISVDGGPWESYLAPVRFVDGTHTISLRAFDTAGNQSSASQVLSVDARPPSSVFTFELPASGWVRGSIDLSGASQDDSSGIGLVELSLDGGESWQALEGTQAWSFRWDTSGVADGAYLLLARARDAAGNQENTARQELGVDNTPPEVSLSGPEQFSVTCGIASIPIQYRVAESASGVASWRLSSQGPNGSRELRSGASGSVDGTLTWDGSGLPAGDYTLTLQAADLAGNTRQVTRTIRGVNDCRVVAVMPTYPKAHPTGEARITNTPSPVPSATPTATRTKAPTATRTPYPTVMKVVAFATPTAGFVDCSKLAKAGESGNQDCQNGKNNWQDKNAFANTLNWAVMGFAVLLLGALGAANAIWKRRTWDLEYRLATQGVNEEGETINFSQSISRIPVLLNKTLNTQVLKYEIKTEGEKFSIEIIPDEKVGGLYVTNFNLCGPFALAALIGSWSGKAVDMADFLTRFANMKYKYGPSGKDILAKGQTTSTGQLAEFLEKEFRWDARVRGRDGVDAARWKTAPGGGPPRVEEIANLLNMGRGLTALIYIQSGLLAPLAEGQADNRVAHWVNILQIFRSSAGEIVRIYNPYKNREELYTWEYFKRSWFGDQGNYLALESKPPKPLTNTPKPNLPDWEQSEFDPTKVVGRSTKNKTNPRQSEKGRKVDTL